METFAGALRIDVLGPQGYTEECMQKFLELYDRYLIAHEISDKESKPHYQGIIHFETKAAYDAAYTRFKRTFDSKLWSKGHRAFPMAKTSNYEIYITKDEDIRYKKNYTEEEINILISKSYKKENNVYKKEKKEKESNFLAAYTFCVDSGITVSSTGWDVIAVLIRYYYQRVKCEPNDFQLKSMAKTILTKIYLDHHASDKAKQDAYLRYRARVIQGPDWSPPEVDKKGNIVYK